MRVKQGSHYGESHEQRTDMSTCHSFCMSDDHFIWKFHAGCDFTVTRLDYYAWNTVNWMSCGDTECYWTVKLNPQAVFSVKLKATREFTEYVITASFMIPHCVELLSFKTAARLWSGGSGLPCHMVSCRPGHAVFTAPYWKTGSTGLWCLTSLMCLSEDAGGLIYNALMGRTTGKHVSWWGSTRALPFITAGYRLAADRLDDGAA